MKILIFFILLCIVYNEGVILKHVNHRLKSEFIIDSAQAFCLNLTMSRTSLISPVIFGNAN